MMTLLLMMALVSDGEIKYRPGDVRPIPRSTNCKHVRLYYGERLPTCTYQDLGRIAIQSTGPSTEPLKLLACSMQADAILFVHRIGLEISGIAVRCRVPFLLPSDFRKR